MKKNYIPAEMSVIYACREDILTSSITLSNTFSVDAEDNASFDDLFKK